MHISKCLKLGLSLILFITRNSRKVREWSNLGIIFSLPYYESLFDHKKERNGNYFEYPTSKIPREFTQ